MEKSERQINILIDWAAQNMPVVDAAGGPITPEEIEEARKQATAEFAGNGPEAVAMVALVDFVESGERAAIVKYLRECGATVTADSIEAQRHRA